jgi:hypothetical protein
MHTANIAAFAGVGFLAIGAIFSVSDVALSRTSFELMIGPVLWIVGCALMVAWAVGRIALSMGRDDQQKSSRLREESRTGTASAGSGRGAVA